MAKRELPAPSKIARLLRYEPETGFLYWRKRTADDFEDGFHSAEAYATSFNKNFAGKRALTALLDGYPHGRVDGKQCRAHRVIWCLCYGDWPLGYIDHIDGDRQNNRLENLRCVTRTDNNRNCRMSKNNTSGRVGVSWSKQRKKWCAVIWHDSKQIPLGRYDLFDDAVTAREQAERDLGYHVNHGN